MPLSTDVRLPRDGTPVFPDRCVACGRSRPGDVMRLEGRRRACRGAACPARRVAALRQARQGAHWFWSSRGWARLVGVMLCAAPVLPWLLWTTLRPPSVDFTVGVDSVEYEFVGEIR